VKQATDYHVIQAMTTYGGGFIRSLGHTASMADPGNLKRIRDAFPDYWAHYLKTAQADLEDEESASPQNDTKQPKQ